MPEENNYPAVDFAYAIRLLERVLEDINISGEVILPTIDRIEQFLKEKR